MFIVNQCSHPPGRESFALAASTDWSVHCSRRTPREREREHAIEKHWQASADDVTSAARHGTRCGTVRECFTVRACVLLSVGPHSSESTAHAGSVHYSIRLTAAAFTANVERTLSATSNLAHTTQCSDVATLSSRVQSPMFGDCTSASSTVHQNRLSDTNWSSFCAFIYSTYTTSMVTARCTACKRGVCCAVADL